MKSVPAAASELVCYMLELPIFQGNPVLFCKQSKPYVLLCCGVLTYLSQQNTLICITSCLNFLAFEFVYTQFLMVMLQTVTLMLSRKLLENILTLPAWPNHHDRKHQILKLWESASMQIGFIQQHLCWRGRDSSVCLKIIIIF